MIYSFQPCIFQVENFKQSTSLACRGICIITGSQAGSKGQQRPKKQSQGGTIPARQAAGPRSAEIGSKGMGFVKLVKENYGFIG